MQTQVHPTLPQWPEPALGPEIPVTLVEILKQTLFYLERGWIQHAAARDARGVLVQPEDPGAVQFCLRGALQRACADRLAASTGPLHAAIACYPPYQDCYTLLETRIAALSGGRSGLESWNDNSARRQLEVLALVEQVIACLK